MHIEQHHSIGKEEIKQRGDALANSLAGMPIPGGVTLSDIKRQWIEDRMDFSFRVSKGFFGADIKGQVLVTETNVALDLDIPPIVSQFVNQEQIERVIKNKMAEVVKA